MENIRKKFLLEIKVDGKVQKVICRGPTGADVISDVSKKWEVLSITELDTRPTAKTNNK